MSVEGSSAARAAAIDNELGDLYGRLAVLHGERASLDVIEPFSAVSFKGTGGELDWLADDYAGATAGLVDLGFSQRQIEDGVPALERIEDALAPFTAWLGTRARLGAQHELAIGPSVRKIGLMGTKRWPGLIPRFDKLQSEADQTQVWPRLWTQIEDKDPRHDGDTEVDVSAPFSVAILLGDNRDPVNTCEPANRYNNPGGVYPSVSSDEQRARLLNETYAHGIAGREVVEVAIGEIVAVNAKRRHANLPFLSSGIATRIVRYDDQGVAGYNMADYTPAIRVMGQRQQLGGVGAEAIQDDIVVRRVLKLDFSEPR